ncbi:helix-turn-helix transcriptional regulator [Rhizobium leguminosarum]|uniref:helix-turn-helix transcriptional regulator n=1 Tax=Rhizobium leguminosarum TaxID=384 RepID=UPI0039E175AE
MSYPAFISTVFILLLSPGPTNTLMGLASARNSFWVVPRLLPAELLGYLTMILPLTWLGGELISRWPETALLLKAVAAIWVMYLAIKLWVAGNKDVSDRSVTARRIYVTTTLNPKALVFGLVLLSPPSASDFLPKLIIFVALASIVAVIWGLITPREKEVLTLMCEGKSAQEIAIILGCSVYTVRTHIGRLKDEFNVYKDTALIAAAFRNRIID